MGLLLPHKSTAYIYPDMVSIVDGTGGTPAGGGKRGEIKVFSPDSRYRLFRLLHQLKFDRVTFCTLTYPADFPTDKKIYKAHLKEYRRRFERTYGKIKGVWRLEFQERGAPHYHIMYLDCPFIPIEEWCNLWSNVIGTDDPNHRKIGVDIKLITEGTESKLIASYLGKYVAKVDQTDLSKTVQKPGRWWGKWNIDDPTPIEIQMDLNEAIAFVEETLQEMNYQGWEPLDKKRCTLFGGGMGTDDFENRTVGRIKEILSRKTAGPRPRNITKT